MSPARISGAIRLGTPFGRYVLDERLGQGGMAEVFKARLVGEGFEKVVCIKRVLPALSGSSEFALMFRDEAAIAARMQHANIVATLDFGAVEGRLFLAMEYIDGATLHQALVARGRQGLGIPPAQAIAIASAMCWGLHHAHTTTNDGVPLDIVHRDVTPQNILLGRGGEVKVADFGVARANERLTTTRTGIVKGKIGYMAPEQVLGTACDHRADQFATGIVLWEMLVGRRLFKGATELLTAEEIVRAAVPAPSTQRAGVPVAIDALVLRALSRRREDRFPDMAAFAAALDEVSFALLHRPADRDLRSLVAETLAPVEDLPLPPPPLHAEPTVDDVAAGDSTIEDMPHPARGANSGVFGDAGTPTTSLSGPGLGAPVLVGAFIEGTDAGLRVASISLPAPPAAPVAAAAARGEVGRALLVAAAVFAAILLAASIWIAASGRGDEPAPGAPTTQQPR